MSKGKIEIMLETEWNPKEISNLMLKEGEEFRNHLIEKIKTAKVIKFHAKRRKDEKDIL